MRGILLCPDCGELWEECLCEENEIAEELLEDEE